MSTIALQPMTGAELRAIADAGLFAVPGLILADGALAPPFVAQRALRQLDDGQPLSWCMPFHIVSTVDRTIVGGCGFKGMPHDGRVEIGYAIAPCHRRQGIATQAVEALLRRAADSTQVREVLAQIDRNNVASTRIAQQLGFLECGTTIENAADVIVQWVRRLPVPADVR